MEPLSFYMRGWLSWVPGDNQEFGAVPPLLKRRVTPLGRRALNAAWELPESKHSRLIFSSRDGEFSRTASLLEAIVAKTELSPADFTLSVHHALAGLLSIAQGNRLGHSAVAAGSETFCYGLIEAVACLKENPSESVALIHYDEPLCAPYDVFAAPGDSEIVLALSLASEGPGVPFTVQSVDKAQDKASPASHALTFRNFLNSQEPSASSDDVSRRWLWARHAAA